MKWYWAIFTGLITFGVALDVSGFVRFPGVGHSTGWIIVVLVLISGGGMAFDGARALVVGDYVTPKSGRYAGQLGTWARFARSVGIEPRSTLMKWIFIGYVLAYLALTFAMLLGAPWPVRR